MDSFNHFDKIANALEKSASQVVRKTAFDIQAKAASRAPVDTGFLRNSIYVTGTGFNTYGRAVQKAKPLKTKGVITRRRLQGYVKRVARQRQQEAMMLAELPPPPEPTSAYVAVGASYGVFSEFGTTRQAAKPYFFPAVEAARPGFDAAMNAIQAKLAEAAR